MVLSHEEEKARRKAFHKETADKRADMLVYVTEPLDKPLTICGPLSAVLYASTSAKDTDWFITLSEVKPDGESSSASSRAKSAPATVNRFQSPRC